MLYLDFVYLDMNKESFQKFLNAIKKCRACCVQVLEFFRYTYPNNMTFTREVDEWRAYLGRFGISGRLQVRAGYHCMWRTLVQVCQGRWAPAACITCRCLLSTQRRSSLLPLGCVAAVPGCRRLAGLPGWCHSVLTPGSCSGRRPRSGS